MKISFKNLLISAVIILGIIGVVIIALVVIPDLKSNKVKEAKNQKNLNLVERSINNEVIRFNLLDPEMSPPNIHDQVMYGYRIILYTNKILSQYVDSHLSCANCHPSGGNTLGGKRGGISLLGVLRIYPRYSKRIGKKSILWIESITVLNAA